MIFITVEQRSDASQRVASDKQETYTGLVWAVPKITGECDKAAGNAMGSNHG